MPRNPTMSLLVLLVVPPLSLGQSRSSSRVVPSTCTVTTSVQSFVPPWPHPGRPARDQFWFGTDSLWTALPRSGSWIGLGHYTPDDPSFRQKLFFWREGYDPRKEPRPNLIITGRRVDSPALPLQTDPDVNGGWTKDDEFIVTGIDFPTTGCWEITARYGQDDELKFTVWVAP